MGLVLIMATGVASTVTVSLNIFTQPIGVRTVNETVLIPAVV